MTDILGFIKHFKQAQETFLTGCCYWFSYILEGCFGGETMYLPVENHFVQRIGGRLYDVTGDVTERYQASEIMPWEEVERYDESLYRRLIRDCVRKTQENGADKP